jgi:DtxR family Mn-dependent transcriptional regulator
MTQTEENYIKSVYHISKQGEASVSTNAIAKAMDTKASSVTDMIKKLSEKNLVNYVKYKGVSLTSKGHLVAKNIIRKHRLWEVFLVEKLNFTWDKVHEVAEQLEHIKSEKLINELDAFLGFPKYDPHGDPIPDKDGNFKTLDKILLINAETNITYKCIGVNDTSSEFLQYLDNNKIALGTILSVNHKEPFDNSLKIIKNNQELMISQNVAKNIFVTLERK